MCHTGCGKLGSQNSISTRDERHGAEPDEPRHQRAVRDQLRETGDTQCRSSLTLVRCSSHHEPTPGATLPRCPVRRALLRRIARGGAGARALTALSQWRDLRPRALRLNQAYEHSVTSCGPATCSPPRSPHPPALSPRRPPAKRQRIRGSDRQLGRPVAHECSHTRPLEYAYGGHTVGADLRGHIPRRAATAQAASQVAARAALRRSDAPRASPTTAALRTVSSDGESSCASEPCPAAHRSQ